MARKTEQRSATIRFATVMTMVARMVAVWPLAPALMININWAEGIAAPWNLAAVGSIVASAVFVEAAWHARSWLMSPVYLALAAVLFLCNAQVAFENVATRSDHRSDHRRSAMVAAKTQSSQRSQWSQGRAQAATVAGETPPAAYQAEIDSRVAGDSRRWQATEECNPLKITAGESRTFCSEIAALKSKLAAAQRRDDLDGKIAALDNKTEATGEVPTTADPFADNVAAFISVFGVRMSEDTKRALSAQKDVLRSVALEIVATFGPTAWLLMVAGWLRPRPSTPRAPEKPARREEKPAPVVATAVEPEPPVALDDPFHKFVAECIEEVPGISAPAGEPWTAWLTWCMKNDLKAGSQKAFGTKMKARFAWEPNNNRPRYLNLRTRQAAPNLRVVASR